MIPVFLAPVAARLASKTTKLVIVGIVIALLAGIFLLQASSLYGWI